MCEFVGGSENLPPVGSVGDRGALADAGRLAGSANRLAEGAPAASGGADFEGVAIPRRGFQLGGLETRRPGSKLDPQCTCSSSGQEDPYSTGGELRERFISDGARPVQGPDGLSANGARLFQTTPTCPEVSQDGLAALFEWTLGLSSAVESDIRVEICPEVRKCREDQDELGQAMTEVAGSNAAVPIVVRSGK